MIISHKNKFIFIKPRKVGSTSVEVNIAIHCGEGDIITKNYFSEKSDENFFIHRARNCKGFKRHMEPDKIRNKIGDEIWNSYFKFTVVRNPWDFIVSLHKWLQFRDSKEYLQIHLKVKIKKSLRTLKKNFFNPITYLKALKMIFSSFNRYKNRYKICKKLKNFENFVKFSEKITNTGYYFDSDGKPFADFYIRFEELEEGYKKVCDILKIPYQKLPRLKSKLRKKGEHYSKFYNDETKKIIAERFKKEIDFFGYKFEVEEK